MNVLRFVISLVLGMALTFAVQWVDRRYLLSPERRARAWNTASWGSALYAFGPFSMLGWAWVTRQRFREWWRRNPFFALAMSLVVLGAGAAAVAVIAIAISAVDWCVETGVSSIRGAAADDPAASATAPSSAAPAVRAPRRPK